MTHAQLDRSFPTLARRLVLFATVAIPLVALAWGSSGSGSSGSGSYSGGSSRGGSSGGSSSGGSCPSLPIATNVSFSFSDCQTCHTLSAGQTNVTRHHNLLKKDSTLGCPTCHGGIDEPGVPITLVRDCSVCHTAKVGKFPMGIAGPPHSNSQHHIVRDACGQCHKDPVEVIHARRAGGSSGSRSGSWGGSTGSRSGSSSSASGTVSPNVCFFCHGNFPQVIAAGVAKGCAACSNCHNR